MTFIWVDILIKSDACSYLIMENTFFEFALISFIVKLTHSRMHHHQKLKITTDWHDQLTIIIWKRLVIKWDAAFVTIFYLLYALKYIILYYLSIYLFLQIKAYSMYVMSKKDEKMSFKLVLGNPQWFFEHWTARGK